MFKQIIHKVENATDRYAILGHGHEDCKCSPRRVVTYRNVGKRGATVIVTFLHKD